MNRASGQQGKADKEKGYFKQYASAFPGVFKHSRTSRTAGRRRPANKGEKDRPFPVNKGWNEKTFYCFFQRFSVGKNRVIWAMASSFV